METKVVELLEEEETEEVTIFKRIVIEVLGIKMTYLSKGRDWVSRTNKGLRGRSWRNHALHRTF